MFDIKQFVPECYVDSRVIQILLNSKVGPNHSHGVGKVLNKLCEKLADYPAIAIVDQDPNKGPKPSVWNQFDLDSTLGKLDNYGFRLYKRANFNQWVIEIVPEIERWILEACAEVHINLEDFNLPQNLVNFNMITKSCNILENKDFTNLMVELINQESPRILKLREVLLQKSGWEITNVRRF